MKSTPARLAKSGEASGKVFMRSILEGAERKEPKPGGHTALCAQGQSPMNVNLRRNLFHIRCY